MPDSYNLVIRHQGGNEQSFKLPLGVYTIGQDKKNKIVLQDPTLSLKHAVVSGSQNELAIEDLHSNTGTYIEGARVNGRSLFTPGQKIQLGGYVLQINSSAPKPAPAPAPAAAQPAPAAQPGPKKPPAPPPHLAAQKELSPEMRIRRNIKRQVHQELLDRLDLRRMTAENIGESGLQERARELVDQIIDDVKQKLPRSIGPNKLADEIYNEAVKIRPSEE